MTATENFEAILTAAIRYREQGRWVVPAKGKAPTIDDWPNVRLDEDGIRAHFRPGHNVGVILGASGLADFDFDDDAAVTACKALAPTELRDAASFQHAGRSHLIVSSAGVKTKRFQRADGSTLVELRGEGAQTIFPPSIHPDGKLYEWIHDREPVEVGTERLKVLTTIIATVAYASEFWNEGSRHDLALALAGFLTRILAEDDVLAVLDAVALCADDAEARDRREALATTVRRLKSGQAVTGLPTLGRLAPHLAAALAKWWEQDDPPIAGSTEKEQPPAQAGQLIKLGLQAKLFRDTTATPLARITVGDHREIWPLGSRVFRRWLNFAFYRESGKPPSGDALASVLTTLEAMAQFEGPEFELHNRLAWQEGSIY